MKFSIVVPCYNEEDNIEPLVQAFGDFANNYEFELVLVDNGSKDSTSQKIDDVIKNHDFVKKVTVEENIGYGFGILSGLKESTGDYLGWIHADLQSDPNVFISMFDATLSEQSPFLYKGARTNRTAVEKLMTIGMGLFESVLFRERMSDVNSQPTLLNRSFYNMWDNPPYDFSLDLYVYVLAIKKNIEIKRFASPQRKRLNGKSSWNIEWGSRIRMIKRVVSYSKEVKNRI